MEDRPPPTPERGRRTPAKLQMLVVFTLPVLLFVAAIALVATGSYQDAAKSRPRPGPLALPTVNAPDAASQPCATLLARLPATLTTGPRPMRDTPIAAPAPPGTAAWVGEDRPEPAVLRCGVPRPAELGPTSELYQIDSVSWLVNSTPELDNFVAVDRQVYVAFSVPRGLGSGPVQRISDTISQTLPVHR
jgi:hypothetical protein